jgi:hypothetical protein
MIGDVRDRFEDPFHQRMEALGFPLLQGIEQGHMDIVYIVGGGTFKVGYLELARG